MEHGLEQYETTGTRMQTHLTNGRLGGKFVPPADPARPEIQVS